MLHERAPAFFEYDAGSLVYVSEDDATIASPKTVPAIAAGFAPADETLPAPLGYPSSP